MKVRKRLSRKELTTKLDELTNQCVKLEAETLTSIKDLESQVEENEEQITYRAHEDDIDGHIENYFDDNIHQAIDDSDNFSEHDNQIGELQTQNQELKKKFNTMENIDNHIDQINDTVTQMNLAFDDFKRRLSQISDGL